MSSARCGGTEGLQAWGETEAVGSGTRAGPGGGWTLGVAGDVTLGVQGPPSQEAWLLCEDKGLSPPSPASRPCSPASYPASLPHCIVSGCVAEPG